MYYEVRSLCIFSDVSLLTVLNRVLTKWSLVYFNQYPKDMPFKNYQEFSKLSLHADDTQYIPNSKNLKRDFRFS